MGVENKPFNLEAAQTHNEEGLEFEFKSKRGEDIVSAVDKAIEYQKKSKGWSDEAEDPTKLALYRIFDTLVSFNQNNVQELTDVQLKTAVQVMTGSHKVGKEFKVINDRLKKNYGAAFNFQNTLNNTMYMLQTNINSVEEYYEHRSGKHYKDEEKLSPDT